MTPLLETFMAKYGWLLAGITIGLSAKYALLIKKGQKITARMLIADLLLLPMVALIAYSLATRAGITGEAAALLAAYCMLGADRLVQLLSDRFFARVESQVQPQPDGAAVPKE